MTPRTKTVPSSYRLNSFAGAKVPTRNSFDPRAKEVKRPSQASPKLRKRNPRFVFFPAAIQPSWPAESVPFFQFAEGAEEESRLFRLGVLRLSRLPRKRQEPAFLVQNRDEAFFAYGHGPGHSGDVPESDVQAEDRLPSLRVREPDRGGDTRLSPSCRKQ